MSEKGKCLDNAVAESFFGTYKAGLLADQPQGRFTNRAQRARAWALTADYIERFYNTVRLHSTLDYKSPVAFELAHRQKEIEKEPNVRLVRIQWRRVHQGRAAHV